MADKYDEAVAYLTENPDLIVDAWLNPTIRRGGAIFLYATPSGRLQYQNESEYEEPGGCLTQIKECPARGCFLGNNLLDEIMNDDRIPANKDDITVENLTAFAEYQRKIDIEVRS